MMGDLCLQICRTVIVVQLVIVYQLYLVCQQYEIEGIFIGHYAVKASDDICTARGFPSMNLKFLFLHSFSSLSYDSLKASYKASSPCSAI
jgi:hypothetical protein